MGGKGCKRKGGKTRNKTKAMENTSSSESSLETVVEGAMQRALKAMMPTIVAEISNNMVAQISKKINKMQTEIRELKEGVRKTRILSALAEDRVEQYSRGENIIIHGLEESDGEITTHLLDKAVEIINVDMTKESIREEGKMTSSSECVQADW